MRKISILLFIVLCTVCRSVGRELPRKAFMGIMVSERNTLLAIDSVLPGSTAEKLGLKKADNLMSINKIPISNLQTYQLVAGELNGGDDIEVNWLRNGKQYTAHATALSKPLFTAPWCDVLYQSLPAIGCTVRTIIYKPKNKTKAPGVFFIPGYNCGSIEGFATNFNGKMIEGWVKSGFVVYTVEKSGLGDSKGCKPCIAVDLQSDIDVFATAYRDFAQQPFTDRNNLFIWGHSMGGIIAPLIAQPGTTKGIIVFGTVFRPWSEFLLEMHRVQKPLLDSLNFIETETFSRLIQKVYYEFFVLKKTPGELYANPEYKKIVETELEYKPGKEDMWGRHWRFWQQLDSINLAKAWQDIDSKVMVFHGGADFIQCSAVEPYLIAEAVNRSHPGNATLETIPQLDHLLMHSKDFSDAAKNMAEKAYIKGNFDDRLLKKSIRWMKTVMK